MKSGTHFHVRSCGFAIIIMLNIFCICKVRSLDLNSVLRLDWAWLELKSVSFLLVWEIWLGEKSVQLCERPFENKIVTSRYLYWKQTCRLDRFLSCQFRYNGKQLCGEQRFARDCSMRYRYVKACRQCIPYKEYILFIYEYPFSLLLFFTVAVTYRERYVKKGIAT